MRITRMITLCALLSATSSFGANGVFMVVKGDIRVKPKSGPEQKAKVGSKINEGDTISSAKDSRAKIVMSDKNILNISPETKLVIEQYKFDEGKDEKNVSLSVMQGKLRSTVNQKYDGEKNQYNVKTPSAVAGVRGTDFVMGFNQVTNSTKVVTFEGTVMTGTGFGAGGKIMNAVPVMPGQFTIAATGQAPAKPVDVPQRELAAMNSETRAETPSAAPGAGGGRDGDNRTPSGNGGDKRNEGAPGTGPNPGPGGPGASSMGVDSKDITAQNGPTPAGTNAAGAALMDCAACARPDTGFPKQLPTELLNTGPTKLILTISQ